MLRRSSARPPSDAGFPHSLQATPDLRPASKRRRTSPRPPSDAGLSPGLQATPKFCPTSKGFHVKNSGVSYERYTLYFICLCAGSSYKAETLNFVFLYRREYSRTQQFGAVCGNVVPNWGAIFAPISEISSDLCLSPDFRRNSARHRTSSQRCSYARRQTSARRRTFVGLLPDAELPSLISLTPVAGLLPEDRRGTDLVQGKSHTRNSEMPQLEEERREKASEILTSTRVEGH
ncbi:hypothetical protein M5K25_016764 [Dendrobium thyrsiflorum]|uniref:Uncharacterized protein n=1 Tax=Dendrobium thyrsiflorum TaxID=117978 RepID=A0ABD0UL17_DENTH